MPKRPTFSQRQGIVPLTPAFQLNSISDVLRNRLWTLLLEHLFDNVTFYGSRHGHTKYSSRYLIIRAFWDTYFGSSVDTIPEFWGVALKEIRDWFFKAEWNAVLDLVDFIGIHLDKEEKTYFYNSANQILEQENSAFRFIEESLAPITDKNEIEALEHALRFQDKWTPVSTHLSTALGLLSAKTNPDFRNSIKESISAVESASRLLTSDPKATLGEAIKLLERGGNLHPALTKALSALYGYTSDEDGIRHSMLDDPQLTYLDAKFMLVICSAFCNRLRGNAA